MSKIMNESTADAAGFEASVLEAARNQAARMVAQAQKDAAALQDALLAQQKGDPVAAHKTELAAALRRGEAAAKQQNLQRMLVYRKQLVNGLFEEAKEALTDFTATPAYEALLCAVLGAHAARAEEGCTVYLRGADAPHRAAISKVLPSARFEEDASIALGGAKLRCGRVLFDETLDERLLAQRNAFLARCNLHVSAKELEQPNEK